MAKERTARNIMNTSVITIREDSPVTNAIRLMAQWKINGLPVLDNKGKLVGIVTGRLIMNTAINGNAVITSVADVMSRDLDIYGPVYSPDTLVEEIITRFASSRINRVLIIKEGKLVGIISRIDIINELDRIYSQFVMS